MGNRARVVGYSVAAGFLILGLAAASRLTGREVRTTARMGLAPSPQADSEAIVQVYAARASGWHGLFGVHTWIAVKAAGAMTYTVYEVIGWRVRYGSPAVVVHSRVPDANWFSAPAELIADKRGDEAAALIDQIDAAARSYPWANEYRIWPGPNSNTFIAWIARAVPGLGLELPSTAIGKDYLGTHLLSAAPSGKGMQLSLFGLVGVLASSVEGVELNILGLSFGVNPYRRTVKLPLVGILGWNRASGAPVPAVVMAPTALPHALPGATAKPAGEPG